MKFCQKEVTIASYRMKKKEKKVNFQNFMDNWEILHFICLMTILYHDITEINLVK